MRTTRQLVLVVFFVLLAAVANAQSSGVGLVMGYPGNIGIIWHSSPGAALRPEFSISKTNSSSTNFGTTVSGDSTAWGLGASALFYVRQWNTARMYVSPRFVYSRATSRSQAASGTSSSGPTANLYQLTGSVGAQYSFARRFGVFGEAGFGYGYQRTSYASGQKSTTKTWSTRTAVGAILYF